MEKYEIGSERQFNLAQNTKYKIEQLINLKKFVIALKKCSNQQQRQVVKQNIKQIINKLHTYLDKTDWKILHQYMVHQLRIINQEQQKTHIQQNSDIIVNESEENKLISYFIKIFQLCTKSPVQPQKNKKIHISNDINNEQEILILKSKDIIRNLIDIIQINFEKKLQKLTYFFNHEFQILLVILYNLSWLYRIQQSFKLSNQTIQNAKSLCLRIFEKQKQQTFPSQINNHISKFYKIFCEHQLVLEQNLHLKNSKNQHEIPHFTKSFPFKDNLIAFDTKNKFISDILICCKQQKKVSLKDYYNISLFLKKTKNYEYSLGFFENIILNFQISQKITKVMMQDQQVFLIFFNSYLHMADIFTKLSFIKWSRSVLQQLIDKLDKLQLNKYVWTQIVQKAKIFKFNQVRKYLSKLSLIQQKQRLQRKDKQDSKRFFKVSLNSYRITKIKQKQEDLNHILKQNFISMPISNTNSYRNSPVKKSYHAYQKKKICNKKFILTSKLSKHIPKHAKQNLSSLQTIQTQKNLKTTSNMKGSIIRKTILSKSNKNIKSRRNMVSIKQMDSTKALELFPNQLQQILLKKQQKIEKNLNEKNFKQAFFFINEYIDFLNNCFKESQKKSFQKYEQIKKIVYQKKISIIQHFQKMNKLSDLIIYIKDLLVQIRIFKKNDIYLKYRQFLTIKLAQCYQKTNQVKLAIDTYLQLAKKGNHQALAKIGQIYLQTQKFLPAIKYFQKYCIQKQFNFQSKVKLAQAYSKIPQYCLKAIDMLNNILLKSSSHSSPIQFVNLYQQQCSQETFQFAILLLSNLYRNVSNIQKAIKICEEYINIMPLTCNIRYVVANYYCQVGNIKKGYESYLDTLKVNPQHHQSLLQLVNFVHQNQNYRTQIINYLKKMIFNSNQKLNYQILKYLVTLIDNKAALKIGEQISAYNLMKCAQIMQKIDEEQNQDEQYLSKQIIKIYLLILQLVQTQQIESILKYQSVYFKLGQMYFRKGNFRQSQKYFQKNLQIIKESLLRTSKVNIDIQQNQNLSVHRKQIIIKLGSLKEAQLKYQQALIFYQQAKQISEDLSKEAEIQLLIALANCQFQLKFYSQAKNNLQEALSQLDKISIDLQNTKGFKPQSKEVVSNIQENIQQKLNQHIKAKIRLKIAFCHDKQQNYFQSKQIYRQILQELPQNREISDICIINLANIYLLTGEEDKYIEQIQFFLKIRPQRDEIREQLISIYKQKGMLMEAQRHQEQKNKNYRMTKILKTIRNMQSIQSRRNILVNQTSICKFLDSQEQL